MGRWGAHKGSYIIVNKHKARESCYIDITCQNCGVVFKRPKPAGNMPKYCGKTCNNRSWVKNNMDKREKRRRQARCCGLRNRHGITADDFDVMLEKQGGVCMICKQPAKGGSGASSYLHVDHCHESGSIRGLLCGNCNTGIGLLNDSPEILDIAADYLRKSREP